MEKTTQTFAKAIYPGFNLPALDLETDQEIYLSVDNFAPSHQPEEIEDSFYNTILNINGRQYAVSSIDLQFN